MSSTDESRIALPLVAREEAARDWHGWMAVADPDAPEPMEPQGEYGDVAVVVDLPAVEGDASRPVELLAPAGGPEAAFAAFHFGADAIYLGLQKFSARAEAENFTLAQVDEITALAHTLTPRRRVFVTVNTLVRQDELPELVADVAALADIGVDAIILQDLGVCHLLRRYFPNLELHASTQLAVHNRAGAQTLRHLGFRRVVLARELTFEEVRDVTAAEDVETEVFIHGALCYSYSGLCLFSSQTLGRSGNRGKCAYSCRDSFEVTGAPETLRDGRYVKRDPATGFPFSMKDLALPDHIPALRAAGVSCFKIEGRKKAPLYVATTTDYYRRLIDGRLSEGERPVLEADMQTVFSRPWTQLFVQSHKDKEVADRDTVGHRGTLIGHVEAVRGNPEPRLRFRTLRALQRHDGLQVDLPTLGKPFGFAVDHLWTAGSGKGFRHEVMEAPAGAVVEVGLPAEYPHLPLGAPVYCSSSQVVKQKYRHERPKPGEFRTRRPVEVEVVITAGEVAAVARIPARWPGESPIEVCRTMPGTYPEARDIHGVKEAAEQAFRRLGATPLELTTIRVRNDAGLFVPVSHLNQLRRAIVEAAETALATRREETIQRVGQAAGLPNPEAGQRPTPRPNTGFQWSIKVDRIGFLDAFEEADFADVEEVVIDITRDHPALLAEKLQHWGDHLGQERIRLALPALTRRWEEGGLRHKIEQLRRGGWRRWEAANLSAWSFLDVDPTAPAKAGLHLATDWSVYVLNRLAARQLIEMGVERFALSPEDGLENMRSLLSEFRDRAVVIVHQDTPLFLAESCAYANLIGGCPGKANCRFESMEMVSSHGERVTALDYHCRTIVLNQGPFCLSTRLKELAAAGAVHLRVDFVYRTYQSQEVRDRWRQVRAGRAVPGGHAANFDRGIL
jgi:putative protease